MLEKPALQDEKISACLCNNYGLSLVAIRFLPLGADLGTAVYHAIAQDGQEYFVKLRRAPFDEIAVTLPKFLSDHGIKQVIAPLTGSSGRLWADLDSFKVILYPFIAGHDVYAADLAEGHWVTFGRALRRIHTLSIPPELTSRIRRETYPATWRDAVCSFLSRIEDENFHDPLANEVAALLHAQRDQIDHLVRRADRLAQALSHRPPPTIVCHSDLHAGNLHLAADNAFYIVDWDAPILAPKERDLMVAGSGLMGGWRSPQEEETLFYHGYGETEIDPTAMAYYRYERIIEDIAIYCRQLLLSDEGGADRRQSLAYLRSNFLPKGTIDLAFQADKAA
jgi:spectinomycin phosphotransferase